MADKIQSQKDNPLGLHSRYYVRKKVLKSDAEIIREAEDNRIPISEVPEYKLIDADPKAEYFVLRLDENGKDLFHINACRIAVQAYANAIEPLIPKLAKDLRERYPVESAATPSDVEQYINNLRKQSFEGWNEDAVNGYLTALKSVEMYQAGQSAVQDATQEHDLPTNIPDGDGDWSINQETFTRGEVFKILFTQRAMITNDLKTSCWDELPETAKNIILNPRKPKI